MPPRARKQHRQELTAPDMHVPRYRQVYVTLRGWIRDGTYPPAGRIPAEPELCEAFGVSRITVRKAIDGLVAEGLLRRRQGSGTYVVERAPNEATTLDLDALTDRVANLGRSTEVLELVVETVLADDETRAALQLPPGAKVQRSSRVRAREGQRLGLVTAWVREDIGQRLKPAELRRRTVLEAIERLGVEAGSAEQRLGACLAGMAEARALELPVGSPLFRIERVVADEAGRPLERVLALWRADAYEYRMQLTRGRRGKLRGWVPD